MELDWEDVRLFVAAWEAGSLSAAATALGIGQATMSRRMAQLEARAGHSLFDRHRSGLQPTEAARLLHPHAVAMAESARLAAAALQGFEAVPEGVVRLAVPPGVAVDLIPPLLPAFQRRHPGVRLEVLSDNLTRDLSRREADIALRSIRPEGGDLVFRRLPDIALRIFASPAYAAALPAGTCAADLAWIQYSEELAHIPLARWVEDRLKGRPPAFTSNSFLALRAAVAAGMGAMILPDLQGRVAGLVPLDVPLEGLAPIPWFLVVHRALRRVPRVEVTVDFLLEAIEAARTAREWPPASM